MNLPEDKKDGEATKEEDENKFEWHDEGVSTLVRIDHPGLVRGNPDTELCDYPWHSSKNIDPTFIASVFTGTVWPVLTSRPQRKGGKGG